MTTDLQKQLLPEYRRDQPTLPMVADQTLPKAPRTKTGRPPKYATADELADKVDAYFERCLGKPLYAKDAEGNDVAMQNGWIVEPRKPSRAEMCLFLGFPSLAHYRRYRDKGDEWADIVDFSLTMMEAYYEFRLDERDKGTAGTIFALKQFAWRDQVELDVQLSKSIPLLSWAKERKQE